MNERPGGSSIPTPAVAGELFGDQLELAERYVALLSREGVIRGLIGPREVERIWDRHVLNSVLVAELIPHGARVIDVGAGAGLPGIPLAIARPDIRMTLLESMARRTDWLTEVVNELGLPVSVRRGRAEEHVVRATLGGMDAVTARAVAPLARLAQWCLPLVRIGGRLLALKGESAADELARDAGTVREIGGGEQSVVVCGRGLVDVPTTVIVVRRDNSARDRDGRPGTRKDR